MGGLEVNVGIGRFGQVRFQIESPQSSASDLGAERTL